MMHIRPSTIADIPAINAVSKASFGTLLAADYAPDVLFAALPSMIDTKAALAGSGSYFVAEVSGVIVGIGGWSGSYPTGDTGEPTRANVRKVAVHPDWLRRGIAAALMAHTHAHAQAAGKTWMHCLSSITAAPFYGSLGYARIGETSIATADPALAFAAIEMRRALS